MFRSDDGALRQAEAGRQRQREDEREAGETIEHGVSFGGRVGWPRAARRWPVASAAHRGVPCRRVGRAAWGRAGAGGAGHHRSPRR
jgi:hypothetical protein